MLTCWPVAFSYTNSILISYVAWFSSALQISKLSSAKSIWCSIRPSSSKHIPWILPFLTAIFSM
uniref:Uncharacterized protein n=1 Tax=Brassica oleracea var. oleracea TaxID=109376 RepID=A0A0D3E866_BRAOL